MDTPGWSVWCARHGVSRCTVLAQACKPNVHLEPTWLWRPCVDKKRTYTLIIHGFWIQYHYNGQRRVAKETEIKPHTRKVRELEDGGRGQPSMHTLQCCCVFCFPWGAVRHSAARHAIRTQCHTGPPQPWQPTMSLRQLRRLMTRNGTACYVPGVADQRQLAIRFW